MSFLGRYNVPRDTKETLMSEGAVHWCLKEDSLRVPSSTSMQGLGCKARASVRKLLELGGAGFMGELAFLLDT